MVTLEGISSQLMKPAKELADWNFPLSQVLEDYYALLEEPCSINFGEAALVLQNSANVYIRRVESLFDETVSLNSSFANYEQEEAKIAAIKYSKKGATKTPFDLDDFRAINLNDELGKNINLKTRDHSKKTIKLLSKRFPQLENKTDLSFSFDIMDIQGEVIGKKYDFRCNQHLSKDGMLVDELTPNNFTKTIVLEAEINKALTSDRLMDSTLGSPGYHSSSPISECNDSTLVSNNHEGSVSPQHSDYCSANLLESLIDVPNEKENSCTNHVETAINLSTISEETHIEHDLDISAESETSLLNITKSLTGDRPIAEEQSQRDKDTAFDNESEIDGGYTSGDQGQISTEPERVSKRNSNTRDINSSNKNAWDPIPFTQGVPDKRPKKRAEFKLPCHISLLKSKPNSRKRKVAEPQKKRESLAKFLLGESELPMKKVSTYASNQQNFIPLKKEEIDDFQKSFDDCFKAGQMFDALHYEAVTTITMDLLGFQPSFDKKYPTDSLDYTKTAAVPSTSAISEEQEHFECLNSPGSSRSSSPVTIRDEPMNEDSLDTTVTYRKRVESKKQTIIEQSDVHTELETAVAKWHESLKPKLIEAEQRPPFRIHEYGTKLINSLHESNERRVDFDSAMEGKEPCEVARYFLATLQLANTYKVDINSSNVNADSIDLVLLEDSK